MSSQSEMLPNGTDKALLEALGRLFADARREWRQESELINGDYKRIVEELRRTSAEAKLELIEFVRTVLAELKIPPGERGERGETGQRGEQGEQGAAGQPGSQGERGERGERGLVGEKGETGDRGAQGESGAPGPPGSFLEPLVWREGKIIYRGELATHNGATWYARADTASMPPGDDWILVAAAGRDAAEGEVCGSYDRERAYRKFDLVAFDGCEWRARRDDPGDLPGDGWALSAVQGKRGAKGERGERGEKGERGPEGEPLELTVWSIEGYQATPIYSDGSTGPVLDMRQFFERYEAER